MYPQAPQPGKRGREESEAGGGVDKKVRLEVECDISANFDLSNISQEGIATEDSDSDFDLDYTVI